jgi:GAF domain-containing protein
VLDLHRQLAATSALVVPIEGSRAPAGALVLGYSTSARRYSARDLAVARNLAQQVALFVAHRSVFDELARGHRRIARMLGRYMAPVPASTTRQSRARARA